MARMLGPGGGACGAAPSSHMSSEISEKKRAEARQWAGGGASRKKYKMPGRNYRCSCTRPPSWRPQTMSRGRAHFCCFCSLVSLSVSLSAVLSFAISLVRFYLGQAWAEGKGQLATCRHRADSEQENRTVCISSRSSYVANE